jgi:hypothetical protein
MNWLRAVLVLGFLSGVSLAGDTPHEEIVKSMLTTMGNLTKTLTLIRDEETARSSKDELKKSVDQFRLLRKKSESMKPPASEEAERLSKQYKSKIEEAQKLLFRQIERVQTVEGGKQALGDIPRVFAPEKKSGN